MQDSSQYFEETQALLNSQKPLSDNYTMSSTDVESIVNLFKQQRISLRYTQVDVAHQLSEISNDKYHQSFIF